MKSQCTVCSVFCDSRCAICNNCFLCDNCVLTTEYMCRPCAIYLNDDVNRLRLNVYQYTISKFQRDVDNSNIYNSLLVRSSLLFNDYRYDLAYCNLIAIYRTMLISSFKIRLLYLRCFIFVLLVSTGITIYLSICLIKVRSLVSVVVWIISWWSVCRDLMKTNVSEIHPNDTLHYTMGRAIWFDIALTIIFSILTIIALHNKITDLILLLSYLTCQAANYTFMCKLRPEF